MAYLLAEFPGRDQKDCLPTRPLLLLWKAQDLVKGGQHISKRLATPCASLHHHVPAFKRFGNALALDRSCGLKFAFLKGSEKLWLEG